MNRRKNESGAGGLDKLHERFQAAQGADPLIRAKGDAVFVHIERVTFVLAECGDGFLRPGDYINR